jgi:hypothetical protein
LDFLDIPVLLLVTNFVGWSTHDNDDSGGEEKMKEVVNVGFSECCVVRLLRRLLLSSNIPDPLSVVVD